jgi:hypothetical protein
MKHTSKFLLVVSALVPAVTFAALGGLKSLLGEVRQILALLEPIIFGLAFLFFFWGVGQFILSAGDPKARTEGRNKMIWGVVALFVMVSIIGILHFVGGLIGIPVGTGASSAFTLQ